MKKERTVIPPKTAAQILFQNRHRCCICRKARKPVQIHHIDKNPANHSLNNLAVLCVDCHSQVSGNQGFGRTYTSTEIILNKQNWEHLCQDWHAGYKLKKDLVKEEKIETEDDVEPIDTHYSDSVLNGDEHEVHEFNLEEGNEMVIEMSADEPIDVMIMRRSGYNRWHRNGEEMSCEHFEDSYELHASFIAPKDGWYSIVLCNQSRDEIRVKVDISIWP